MRYIHYKKTLPRLEIWECIFLFSSSNFCFCELKSFFNLVSLLKFICRVLISLTSSSCFFWSAFLESVRFLWSDCSWASWELSIDELRDKMSCLSVTLLTKERTKQVFHQLNLYHIEILNVEFIIFFIQFFLLYTHCEH